MNTNWWAIGFLVYLFVGLLSAAMVDRSQMKKQIPYEDFPAMPLRHIRLGIFCFYILFGVPCAVRYFYERVFRKCLTKI